jgi:hypothetical protein
MKWKVEHLKKTVPLLLAHGEAAELVTEVAGRVYSTRVSYLLRRDTAIPFTSPAAKIPIIVREIRPDDFPVIVSERPIRLPALESGLKTCHVATTENNDICYMQWLIDSSQNELIDREFAGLCPTLKQNEMLLEWAYTFKKYRGLAVMASAMSQISERGAACGAAMALHLRRDGQYRLAPRMQKRGLQALSNPHGTMAAAALQRIVRNAAGMREVPV